MHTGMFNLDGPGLTFFLGGGEDRSVVLLSVRGDSPAEQAEGMWHLISWCLDPAMSRAVSEQA